MSRRQATSRYPYSKLDTRAYVGVHSDAARTSHANPSPQLHCAVETQNSNTQPNTYTP